MNDNIFIDTNIFVYTALVDEETFHKHQKAIQLFKSFPPGQPFISTQVLAEFNNTLIRNKIPDEDIQEKMNIIIENSTVALITVETLRASWKLRERYHFSLWDCLILASAIESECTILYTEDLQHKQIINNQLQILNPFL